MAITPVKRDFLQFGDSMLNFGLLPLHFVELRKGKVQLSSLKSQN